MSKSKTSVAKWIITIVSGGTIALNFPLYAVAVANDENVPTSTETVTEEITESTSTPEVTESGDPVGADNETVGENEVIAEDSTEPTESSQEETPSEEVDNPSQVTPENEEGDSDTQEVTSENSDIPEETATDDPVQEENDPVDEDKKEDSNSEGNIEDVVVNNIQIDPVEKVSTIPESKVGVKKMGMRSNLLGATPDSSNTEDCVANIGETCYSTLEAAISASSEGDTITMNKDYTVTNDKRIYINTGITLNLNGYTISKNVVNTEYVFQVNAGKSLTIEDTRGNGKISREHGLTAIMVLGTLTVNGGTIESLNGKQGYTISIKCDEDLANNISGHVIVEHGTIIGDQAIQNRGNVTINGGSFSGDINSWSYQGCFPGNTTINGGTIKGNVQSIQRGNVSTPAVTTINGGTIDGMVSVSYKDITANEGTNSPKIISFTNQLNSPEGYKREKEGESYKLYQVYSITYTGLDNATNPPENITGYTAVTEFTFKAPSLEGKGFQGWFSGENKITDIKKGTTGDITLAATWGEAVAKIGEISYTTLQDAIDAAESGATVILLQDISVTNIIDIKKSLTLDGSNHTITNNANRGIWIDDANVNVTLKNFHLNVISTDTSSYPRGIQVNTPNVMLNMDNVHVDYVSYYAFNVTQSASNLTAHITNSTLSGWAALNIWGNNGNITVENSTLIGKNNKTYNANGGNNFQTIVINNTVSGTTVIIKDTNIQTQTDTLNRQDMVDLRKTGNTIMFLGNTTYSSGGTDNENLFGEGMSFRGNKIYFDETAKSNFYNLLNEEKSVKISETSEQINGNNLYMVLSNADVYYYWLENGEKSGVDTSFVTPFVEGRLDNNEFIELNKDIILTGNIMWNKTNASFTLHFGDYAITKGEYSVMLQTGASVVTDKKTDVFTTNEGNSIVESKEGDSYKYSVVANDEIVEVTLNPNIEGEENITKKVKKGETFSNIETIIRTGYTLSGWTREGESDLFDFSTPITENITLNAEWTVNQYTITFKDGETVVSTITGDYGTTITAPANLSKSCYRFSWDKTIPTTMPAEDMIISAKWTYSCRSGGGGGSYRAPTKTNTGDLEEVVLSGEVETVTKDEKSDSLDEAYTPTASDYTNYDDEVIKAYQWAKKYGITTTNSMDEARLDDPMTRGEMAKILAQFYKLFHNTGATEEKAPANYPDVKMQNDLKDYIELSYQYNIMGIYPNGTPLALFRPNDTVIRSEFGTALSRIMFGTQYNEGGRTYYERHLEVLRNNGTIKNTTPNMKELRKRAFVMLYRTQN